MKKCKNCLHYGGEYGGPLCCLSIEQLDNPDCVNKHNNVLLGAIYSLLSESASQMPPVLGIKPGKPEELFDECEDAKARAMANLGLSRMV